jgi:hypothetical protein
LLVVATGVPKLIDGSAFIVGKGAGGTVVTVMTDHLIQLHDVLFNMVDLRDQVAPSPWLVLLAAVWF